MTNGFTTPEAKMKEPEPYRDADIWFSETEEEEAMVSECLVRTCAIRLS